MHFQDYVRTWRRLYPDAGYWIKDYIGSAKLLRLMSIAAECDCGFVHDICKGERCHEAAAGRLLRTCGLVRMATLVEAHRDMTLPDNLPFTERELVFLADKYVRGKWPVTLEERFHSKMELFAGDDAAVAAIEGRMKRAQAMAVRLAEECGRAPAELAREALAE